MIICRDCEKWIPDEELVYYSLDAYDEDPDCFCPYCGSDYLDEVEDDAESLRGN